MERKLAELTSIMEVLELAEKLKFELRHSWLSNGRQESVAEHTWRMSLIAVLLEPVLDQKINMTRLLKMIIIHDLVEAEAGDVSLIDQMRNPDIKKLKQAREEQAIQNLRDKLSATNGQEIYDLFFEFETKETYEAKVANALDKLEVQLQHNHADMETWEEIEYELAFLMSKHTAFDQTIDSLKNLILKQTKNKLTGAGLDIDVIEETANKRFNL